MDIQKEITVFLAEFDYQIEQIQKVYSILEEKKVVFDKEPVASEMVESTGYWLHNLYSAFEDLFKLTAGFWENNVNIDGDFHVNLLKRMLVHIEQVRPALISEQSYQFLNELRGFRHVFRHAYSFGMDDERVSFLLFRVLKRKELLIQDLKKFRKAIADI
jgi:hypothetical protein